MKIKNALSIAALGFLYVITAPFRGPFYRRLPAAIVIFVLAIVVITAFRRVYFLPLLNAVNE
jgi:hypothetical protein